MKLHPAIGAPTAVALLMIGACDRQPGATVEQEPTAQVSGDTAAPPSNDAQPVTTPPPVQASSGEQGGTDDWQSVMSAEDKDRLSRIDEAWASALEHANRDWENRGALKMLSGLVRPDAALAGRLHPSPGTYRCRTIKLGPQGIGSLDYVAYPYFQCRVELTAGGDLIIEKTSGSQRFRGLLYPDTDKRLVYVGTQAWGDEKGYPAYGAQAERDESGVLERLGDDRWRLVIPWPKQESQLNIIEILR